MSLKTNHFTQTQNKYIEHYANIHLYNVYILGDTILNIGDVNICTAALQHAQIFFTFYYNHYISI